MQLAENVNLYKVYNYYHGLERKVPYTKFQAPELLAISVLYLLCKNALWVKICDQIKANILKIYATLNKI